MLDRDGMKLLHEMREQGVDWQTIHDTLGSNDADRKAYVGYRLALDNNDDKTLIKHAKTLQNIRLSRKQLGIERSINNEQIRDITLHKTFTQQVLESIKDKYVDFKIHPILKGDIKAEKAHIFTVADFHYNGEQIYLEDLKMATRRIVEVIKEKDLEHIYLVELGDVIEGASLRPSQLMAVKSGMVSQLVEVVDAYIKMITYLSEFVDVTFVSVDSSNHTQLRQLGTKQNQLIEEDLMVIFNEMIRTALPNLDMYTGEDVLLNILGFNIYFEHGHKIRSKEKYLETLQSDRNILIDYGFFGHFHHARSIDLHSVDGCYDRKVFYVPSLKTEVSDYEKTKNLSSCAGVGYYMFDDKYGHIETRKLLI